MNKRVQKIQDLGITKVGGNVMRDGTGGGAFSGTRKSGGLPDEIKIGDDLLSDNEKEYIRTNSEMEKYSIQDLVWNIENMLIPYLELQNSDEELNGIAEGDFSQKHPDGVGEDPFGSIDSGIKVSPSDQSSKQGPILKVDQERGFIEKIKDKFIEFFS